MFKLIKINNSTSNTPEIETLKKLSTLKFMAGEAVVLNADKAIRCSAYERPTHITLAQSDVGETTVRVYRITSNMVFEADHFSDGYIAAGDKLPLASGNTGSTVGVSDPDMDIDYAPATAIGYSNGKAIIIFE